jgi:hypothetical protein
VHDGADHPVDRAVVWYVHHSGHIIISYFAGGRGVTRHRFAWAGNNDQLEGMTLNIDGGSLLETNWETSRD